MGNDGFLSNGGFKKFWVPFINDINEQEPRIIKPEDVVKINIADIKNRRNQPSIKWVDSAQYQKEISEIMQWRDLFYSHAINQLPEKR